VPSPVSSILEDLFERASTAAASLEILQPEFPVRIGWLQSYEDLFTETPNAQSSPEALLEGELRHRRLVLAGRGGSGKSIVLAVWRGCAAMRKSCPYFLIWQDGQVQTAISRRTIGEIMMHLFTIYLNVLPLLKSHHRT